MAGGEDTNPHFRVPVRRPTTRDDNGERPTDPGAVFTADYHYETRGQAPKVQTGHHWLRTAAAVVVALIALAGIVYAAGEFAAKKADSAEVEKSIDRHREQTQHRATERAIESIRTDVREIRESQTALDANMRQVGSAVDDLGAKIERMDRRNRRRRRR